MMPSTARAILLFAAIACAGESPAVVDEPEIDEIDPDCPRPIDVQTFVDFHLLPMCEHGVACFNEVHGEGALTVEQCFNGNAQHMLQTRCWQPCIAGACATWVDEVEECLDPPGATDESCLQMMRCEQDR